MNAFYPVFAIIRLSLHQAVHSRAAVWMLLTSLAISGGLPFALKGDGTATGVLSLIVTYTPALLFSVLLIGTVWLAAGLISLEIEGTELTSVMVKPIRSAQVWIGKWTGILILDATLLLLSALMLLLAVNRIVPRLEITEQDIATARLQVLSGKVAFSPCDANARSQALDLQFALRQNNVPEKDLAIDRLVNTIKAEKYRISPGNSFTWIIPFPNKASHLIAPEQWSLKFLFRCDALQRSPVEGTWTITSPETSPVSITVESLLDGEHHVMLPPETAFFQGPIAVTFSNSIATTTAVLFDPQAPVVLLRHASTFTSNVLRGFLTLFCFLAAAAALALTMGTLFTFPVALFTTIAFLLAVLIAQTYGVSPVPDSNHATILSHGAINHAGEYLIRGTHLATASTFHLLPLSSLSNGYHIAAAQVLNAVLILLIGIPAVLCAVASLVLAGKEFE